MPGRGDRAASRVGRHDPLEPRPRRSAIRAMSAGRAHAADRELTEAISAAMVELYAIFYPLARPLVGLAQLRRQLLAEVLSLEDLA